jgi:hypothetical protein
MPGKWKTRYEAPPAPKNKNRKTPPGKATSTFTFAEEGEEPFVHADKVEVDDTSEVQAFVDRARAALEAHRAKRAEAKPVEDVLDGMLNA